MKNKMFEFYLPTKILFGCNILDRVGENARMFGEKALIVTGKASAKKYGVIDKIVRSMNDAGVQFSIYDKIEPNPSTKTVEKGAKFAEKVNCDLVVGVGGGSSIDAAKVIGALLTNNGQCIDFKGEEKIENPSLPMVAIPTTSGSGSEVTRYAVITDEKSLDKFEIVSKNISPKVALIDPVCTLTLPSELTASTGMDALTHAIEGYISLSAQSITDALALLAIRIVAENLELAVRRGSNLTARENMSLAALLGGIIINNVRTGLVHAMARPLGGYFRIPHGTANAIVLPRAMGFNLAGNLERFRNISEAFGENVIDISLEKAAKKSVEKTTKLSEGIGIPKSLKELGVEYQALPKLAQETLKVKRLKKINPRPIKFEEVLMLYKKCWKGD